MNTSPPAVTIVPPKFSVPVCGTPRAEALDVLGDSGDDLQLGVLIPDDVEEHTVSVNYRNMLEDLKVGERVTVDNGLINLEVLAVESLTAAEHLGVREKLLQQLADLDGAIEAALAHPGPALVDVVADPLLV